MGHNGQPPLEELPNASFYKPGKASSAYPHLEYKINVKLDPLLVIDLYNSAGLNRPVKDVERIRQMYENSNLTVTAWDGDLLVGVARSVTDFVYCCYVSDLAIRKEYQKGGIGHELLQRTKDHVGHQSNLFLLAAPSAMEYYPKIGMSKIENGFIVKRLYD